MQSNYVKHKLMYQLTKHRSVCMLLS